MHRQIRDKTHRTSTFRTGSRLAAGLAIVLSLASCQQFQTPEDLLFAPTFNKSRQNIPYTYNTPYDCRSFAGSGWKGIAGGRVYNFSNSYVISEAGCFKTQKECLAYLTVMRTYIDQPKYIRCNPYTA